MQFQVYKSSMDGISGSYNCQTPKEICSQISFFRGWDSLKQLHAAIKKWAKSATPGDVFATQVSVIVCTKPPASRNADEVECPECLAESHLLTFQEFEAIEDGTIVQDAECTVCGYRWQDVFRLAERHTLVPRGKATRE